MPPLFSAVAAFFALAAALSLCLPSSRAEFLRVPMKIRAIRDEDVSAGRDARGWQRTKVWMPQFSNQTSDSTTRSQTDALPSDRRRHPGIALHYASHIYYGEISLGTPPQLFHVLFDTFAGDLWVPDKPCRKHNVYNHSASSTYEANGTDFSLCLVSGVLPRDVLRVGDLTVSSVYFGEVNETSGIDTFYPVAPYDGVFGLGFSSKNVVPVETPLQQLVREKMIDRAMFGFYFGRHETDGELTLGGVNEHHFEGDLHYMDVVSSSDWAIELQAVQVGEINIAVGSEMVLHTMAGSMTSGPRDAIKQIADAVGAKKHAAGGVYWIDCSAEPTDIVFVISGRAFTISKDEYILRYDDPHKCVLSFLEGDATWLVGMQILRKYYLAFDMSATVPRIGFALAV